MELSEVNCIREETLKDVVNECLRGGWVLLCVTSGREEDGGAYFLYVLGRA